jgi:hypothetical protein
MAKLPPQFVKAPPAPTAAPKRRSRKTSLVPEARDVRELLLRLTDDEHRALEEARAALQRGGEEVTLEQMIHRVLAEWTLRNRLARAPAPEPRREERLVDRLRALATAPLRTWRELGASLRRMSGLPAR